MENVLTVKDESKPFVLMDRLDDDLIIQELEGRMPEILTYHFADKGQEIWGLSKAGVDEAKAELSKQGECLRVIDHQFTDNESAGLFIVKAGRYVINRDGKEIMLDSTLGAKRQAKKTPTGKENPFWFEQGIAKAQRNAFHSLIPKSIVNSIIEYAKKSGRVKEVKDNGKQGQSIPSQKKKTSEAPSEALKETLVEGTVDKISEKGSGFKVGNNWYGAFDTNDQKILKEAHGAGRTVSFQSVVNEKGFNNIIKNSVNFIDEPGSEEECQE